jgi:imidazoleglycerol-phosphate dehydratase
MARESKIVRNTKETEISLSINLDGKGEYSVATGVGFLDHMLELFARHGMFDLNINATGDLKVDAHHTVEDIGIVLGQAIKEALGDKKSIKRYGTAYVPMDETLAFVTLDISNRSFLIFDVTYEQEKAGDMDTELFEEFFRAVATNIGLTLHIKSMYGSNNHHIVEAIFKAFAHALKDAVAIDESISGVLSTKGVL